MLNQLCGGEICLGCFPQRHEKQRQKLQKTTKNDDDEMWLK